MEITGAELFVKAIKEEHVTRPEDMEKAFENAKRNLKTPSVIEFIIDREINVLPIVPPGNALSDMILES